MLPMPLSKGQLSSYKVQPDVACNARIANNNARGMLPQLEPQMSGAFDMRWL